MARRDLNGLVAKVRLDAEQKALREALLVPWRRLKENAKEYVEWHTFVLWMRAITESVEEVPAILQPALEHRCPGFLESDHPNHGHFHWQALEEWIATHRFSEAKAGGWFGALTYYAYQDLRTEQAWTLWKRTKEAWCHERPSQWPSFEEWTAQIHATHSLTQQEGAKAAAVRALANVDPADLRRAVSELLESRAFALWIASISQPDHVLPDVALRELRRRFPLSLTTATSKTLWHRSLFFRIVRSGEGTWRLTARTEGWSAALRHELLHHPRRHRLVHYFQRCVNEWLQVPRPAFPTFECWLRAADDYLVESQT